MNRSNLKERILRIHSEDFESLAFDLFRYQFNGNPIYRKYCQLVKRTPERIIKLVDIPFLPVSLFKTHRIITNDVTPELVFRSSATAADRPSLHYVHDSGLYRSAAEYSAENFPGDPSRFAWLGLLPSYLERKDASLIYMVDHFMRLSGHAANGYFLDDFKGLAKRLQECEDHGIPAILIGVSFALMDFADAHPMRLRHTRIIETGGMKGRREELTREQLHDVLSRAFSVSDIGSEYGMTELLSQAWSERNGIFNPGPLMRIMIRDLTDPLVFIGEGKRGAISVIDLANIDSCAFIATDDIGIAYAGDTFKVLGRMDGSDLRGCNLMVGEEG